WRAPKATPTPLRRVWRFRTAWRAYRYAGLARLFRPIAPHLTHRAPHPPARDAPINLRRKPSG
ncbi:MAG TPA: hypothetical protein VMU71_01075, partial [Terracidiphilus sp.]|nr:hypothetical protein [Terracidiphilus sp.]